MGAMLLALALGLTSPDERPIALGVRAGRAQPAVALSFADLLEPDPAVLRPSARVLSLDGRRVRLVGFMARMTAVPHGGFYLVPRPLFCDEAGGGGADLPPTSVRVVVPSAGDHPIAFTPRAVEVTGVLTVGNRAEPDGHTSNFRIVLDGPPSSRKENKK
jgi:hypothetical protein